MNEKRLSALNRTVEVQRALLTHYVEGAGADADEVIAESKPEEKEIMVAVTMNMTGK